MTDWTENGIKKKLNNSTVGSVCWSKRTGNIYITINLVFVHRKSLFPKTKKEENWIFGEEKLQKWNFG